MKEVLITSSVLIVVLLILRAVFAKKVRRTLIYGAWALVALRLLIPVQIGHLPFSVLNLFQPATETVTQVLDTPVVGKTEQDAYQQVLQDYVQDYIEKEQLEEPFEQPVFTPEVQDHIQSALDQELPKEDIVGSIEKDYAQQEVYVPEVQPQVQQKVEESTDAVTLGQIAAGVWLVGMVVVAIWLAVGNLTIVRSLKRSAKVLAWDSPIPVYVSQKAISPCLVGLFRPKIYVTPECAEDETVLRHVMTHELTHYAHRDHIWSAVRCLCLCLYWFDPLVWVAALCSRRDCELACDEGALRRLGEDQRIAYGKALLEVVRSTAVPGRLMLTATTMAETKKQLLRRVNFIANRPRWSMIAAVSMVLVCALVAGCVATGAEVPSVANDPTLPSTETVLDPTEPIVTEPTVTEPTVTEPTVTEPTVTESTVTEPTVTVPTVTEPTVTESTVTEPTVTVPTVTTPTVTEPPVTKPTVTEPTVTKPTVTTPTVTEPTVTEPSTVVPTTPPSTEIIATIAPLRKPSSSGFYYQITGDGTTCMVTGLEYPTDVHIVIPETLNGYQVTAIGTEAFASTEILTVVMPNSVTEIHSSAFSRCRKLRSITFSNQLTTINSSAFYYCINLKELTLPATLSKIGGFVFSECSGLTGIVLPDGLTSISISTFNGCSNLTSITIPDNITSIDRSAFNRCTNLINLTIGKGVTSIHPTAFSGCTALAQISVSPKNTAYHSVGNCLIETETKTLLRAAKDFVIPSDGSVTTISSRAFTQLIHLRQIVLPEGIQTIHRGAFGGCTELVQVYLPQSLQSIENPIESCSALKDIYYNGTRQQWDTIKKSTDVNVVLASQSIVVHCTDGQLTFQ